MNQPLLNISNIPHINPLPPIFSHFFMKLTLKQRIVLDLFTLLAMLLAPVLLVVGLVRPVIAFVINEVWCSLMFPHDVRVAILKQWEDNLPEGNDSGSNKPNFSGNGSVSNN